MVSLRAKIVCYLVKRFSNINSMKNPNNLNNIIESSKKNLKFESKKGYSFKVKETDNKSKYVVLSKDSNKEAKKVIYYIHGGAYVCGLVDMYEDFTYPFCDLRDDIEVVLLDYSLAPEYKFPTQLNQAYDVWNEITKQFKPEYIIIGGDSCGGNAALALIHKLKKEDNVSPRATFLLSPWTDMTCSSDSYYKNYQKDVMMGDDRNPLTEEIKKEMLNSQIFCFVGDADRKDPYVSPIYGDFTTFPKSLFIVGSHEVLLDDTLVIVDKLKENNNEVELINEEGMFHVYPIYANILPESKNAIKRIKNFIIESFQ